VTPSSSTNAIEPSSSQGEGWERVERAVVEAVCISQPGVRVAKRPVDEAFIGPHGFVGDRHEAELRRKPYGRGTAPNHRQWHGVCTEETNVICTELGLPPLPYGALGENLRLSGVLLGELPNGTELMLPSGARLRLHQQTDPCINAAKELAATYGEAANGFVKAALGRRGVVGQVIEPGIVRPGDVVLVHLPDLVST
jgi:MOSC domain-containing protein YiiM